MIPIKPKNVFWSDEQWQAIHEYGKNILVNAGAGSGKTAVLTERIVEKLKKGVGLDRLIVLTFTKAAASEMKERVRKQLNKIVKEYPELTKDLGYLDQAAIQTFDSFALSLVKKYHYLLGVSRDINIGDGVLLAIKLKEIINDVFDYYYENENKEFLDFVDTFTVKNDKQLQTYIYNIYSKIELLPESNQYLENYLDLFYSDVYINKRIKEFSELIHYDIDRIRNRLMNIEVIVSDDRLVKYYNNLRESLIDLLASRTYKGFFDNIDVKFPRLPSNCDEDEKNKVSFQQKEIKKIIDNIKSYLIYNDENEIKAEIIKTKDHAKIIIEIIKEVDRRFKQFKFETNLFGFLDIAKLAIDLFKNNQDLRNLYTKKIHEILIDEYQDTSDIQEILISLISRNNVYMVGDMKQSIYRFRNANPDIFKEKYELYKNSDQGLAIDLSKNFRSRKEVLENINLIFSRVMSLELGGVDYNHNHSLKFGNLSYLENAPNPNYNLDILTYETKEDGLTQTEKEAFIVGRDILKKIEAKYQIYDKDKKEIRSCKFSDFTILASEKSKFEIYKKIFEYLGLPLVIHKDEDFVRSNEVYVIKNILRCIYSLNNYEYYKDNFKDAIVSVLRSFLVEARDEDISLIFLGDIKEGLNLRFKEFYQDLINISRLVEKESLSEILAEIYRVFDVYYKVLKLGNVEEIENKLNYLLTKFSELDKINYTLLDAINYLEVLITEGFDIQASFNSKIDENAINMMSIHMSKGLEFPVCYFVELSSKFKTPELRDRILFDKNYGIILPVFNEGLKDTIIKILLKENTKVEEISERLRLFYVALTRAKEKIIMVSEEYNEANDYKNSSIPIVDRLNYNSFFSIINSLKYNLIPYTQYVLVNGSKDYENKVIGKLTNKPTKPIEFRSVSLKMEKEEHMVASKSTKTLLTKDVIENMEFGTLIHEYFELIDLKEDIIKQLDSTDLSDEIKAKILKFYSLDIFKKDIINIYHELQFSYTKDNIMYRGIIDMIVETKDEITIIDFKLSDLDKTEYVKQIQVYYSYLKDVVDKPINAYLYSIINEEFRLVI